MIFKRKFKKKEQKNLEIIKLKENSLKSLDKSIQFLESQSSTLSEKGLSDEDFKFELDFINEKLNTCRKRRDLCKKELDLLKTKGVN